jgi:hypothetical protein
MNRPYTYHLTWNRSVDADHALEVDVTNPTTQQVQMLRFPDDQTWLGIRRRRYRVLAYQVANDTELAATDDITATQASLIPQAVGGFAMKQSGSENARLRCVVHLPLTPNEVDPDDGAPRDPFDAGVHRTVYDAHVLRDASGVQLLPLSTDQRSAPGVR